MEAPRALPGCDDALWELIMDDHRKVGRNPPDPSCWSSGFDQQSRGTAGAHCWQLQAIIWRLRWKKCNIFYADVRIMEQTVEKERLKPYFWDQHCVETARDSSCADSIRNYPDDKGKRKEAILCISLLFWVQSAHIFSTAISIPPPKTSQQSTAHIFKDDVGKLPRLYIFLFNLYLWG